MTPKGLMLNFVYLMPKKSESYEMFKEFKAEAEKELDKNLKSL